MATIAVALLLAIVLFAGIVTLRKRTAPENEPPLHPSTVIAIVRFISSSYCDVSKIFSGWSAEKLSIIERAHWPRPTKRASLR